MNTFILRVKQISGDEFPYISIAQLRTLHHELVAALNMHLKTSANDELSEKLDAQSEATLFLIRLFEAQKNTHLSIDELLKTAWSSDISAISSPKTLLGLGYIFSEQLRENLIHEALPLNLTSLYEHLYSYPAKYVGLILFLMQNVRYNFEQILESGIFHRYLSDYAHETDIVNQFYSALSEHNQCFKDISEQMAHIWCGIPRLDHIALNGQMIKSISEQKKLTHIKIKSPVCIATINKENIDALVRYFGASVFLHLIDLNHHLPTELDVMLTQKLSKLESEVLNEVFENLIQWPASKAHILVEKLSKYISLDQIQVLFSSSTIPFWKLLSLFAMQSLPKLLRLQQLQDMILSSTIHHDFYSIVHELILKTDLCYFSSQLYWKIYQDMLTGTSHKESSLHINTPDPDLLNTLSDEYAITIDAKERLTALENQFRNAIDQYLHPLQFETIQLKIWGPIQAQFHLFSKLSHTPHKLAAGIYGLKAFILESLFSLNQLTINNLQTYLDLINQSHKKTNIRTLLECIVRINNTDIQNLLITTLEETYEMHDWFTNRFSADQLPIQLAIQHNNVAFVEYVYNMHPKWMHYVHNSIFKSPSILKFILQKYPLISEKRYTYLLDLIPNLYRYPASISVGYEMTPQEHHAQITKSFAYQCSMKISFQCTKILLDHCPDRNTLMYLINNQYIAQGIYSFALCHPNFLETLLTKYFPNTSFEKSDSFSTFFYNMLEYVLRSNHPIIDKKIATIRTLWIFLNNEKTRIQMLSKLTPELAAPFFSFLHNTNQLSSICHPQFLLVFLPKLQFEEHQWLYLTEKNAEGTTLFEIISNAEHSTIKNFLSIIPDTLFAHFMSEEKWSPSFQRLCQLVRHQVHRPQASTSQNSQQGLHFFNTPPMQQDKEQESDTHEKSPQPITY